MNIEDIIKGCKEGNRASQDALVQKFASGLLSLCIRYTSDYDLGRDALQECFLNAFKYIHQYTGKGSFEGWLKRIAVHAALSVKKKFRSLHFDHITEDRDWQYAEIPDIYSELQVEAILLLLRQLPETLYLVFNLYVVEGYQHSEISGMLGITESTSRASLCKARNRLIELIKNQEKYGQTSLIHKSIIS